MASQHPATAVGAFDEGSQAKKDFWHSYFSFYDRLNLAIPYRRMIEYHLDGLRPGPGDEVLEAGTGSGNVAVELVRSGARLTGIDFCPPALEICRAKAPAGEYRFGDLTKPLEFGPDRFDKICCCSVLQFIRPNSQEAAVREFFRVLKPGGLITITVFAEGFTPIAVYKDTLREHRRRNSFGNTVVFAVRHSYNTVRFLYYVRKIRLMQQSGEYHYFSPASLAELMRKSGFEVLHSGLTFSDQAAAVTARKPTA
jgi:ubiquinone/menaquinone biosynthesis C-methylase UbiE